MQKKEIFLVMWVDANFTQAEWDSIRISLTHTPERKIWIAQVDLNLNTPNPYLEIWIGFEFRLSGRANFARSTLHACVGFAAEKAAYLKFANHSCKRNNMHQFYISFASKFTPFCIFLS